MKLEKYCFNKKLIDDNSSAKITYYFIETETITAYPPSGVIVRRDGTYDIIDSDGNKKTITTNTVIVKGHKYSKIIPVESHIINNIKTQ